MKIALLTTDPSHPSSERLVEAIRAGGHEPVVVDYLRCYMNIASHRPEVIYGGEPLVVDAVIPRVDAAHTFYGTAVVRQFEMMEVFCVNSSLAISRSRDKLRCLQLLSRKGIGLPVTGFAHSTKDVDGIIELVGGAPLVVKLLEGPQGMGVVLCETKKAAESVIEAFRGLDANILVQEFIGEANGVDIRAYVVGEKVVASLMRKGTPGEFRSNTNASAATKIKLTPEERSTASRSAKAMGLRVCSVDLLRSNHGPVVMDVGSAPELELVEHATGTDVAASIVKYIEDKAAGRGRERVKA